MSCNVAPPVRGKVKRQIEEALLSGHTPQGLADAGFNPGGISYLVYTLSSQGRIKRPPGFVGWLKRAQREWILRRDNYTCQNCGARGPGISLELHHKDHNKRNNRSSNRVTWCAACNFEDGQRWAAKLRESKESPRAKERCPQPDVGPNTDKMSEGMLLFMRNLLQSLQQSGLH